MFSNYFFRVGKNIAKMSFWKRRTANITDYDPTYRVVYLGNVLTGWAKGKKDKRITLSLLGAFEPNRSRSDLLLVVTRNRHFSGTSPGYFLI